MTVPLVKFTPYERHRIRWQDCDRCDLCQQRSKVVLARGKVPAPILFIGEAPGACIAGDTLIDTAYRDKSKYPEGIPIKDLVGQAGFKVYSLDQSTGKLCLGTVSRVWKTGIRKVYTISFSWWGGRPDGKGGRHKYHGSITVTDNHPFLLKSGEYQSIKQGLKPGTRLQPFYRRFGEYHYVGASSKSLVKESRFLMESKLGRQLAEGEQIHHISRNKLDDQESNLELSSITEHARIHGLEDNVMFNPRHRATHKSAMGKPEYRQGQSERMRAYLAGPGPYQRRVAQIQNQRAQTSVTVKHKFANDPVYYYRYLKGRKFRDGTGYSEQAIRAKLQAKFPNEAYPPSDNNHVVTAIKPVGIKAVYDMEVSDYHNFVANGVFVHNSEDVIGRPFVGPAGHLLDQIIESALDGQWDYAITNLVGCFPRDAKATPNHEPPKEAIEACAPRLLEFVRLCRPKLIILVGKLAAKSVAVQAGLIPGKDSRSRAWVPSHGTLDFREIIHPAAILRMDVSQQGLAIQRAIVTIEDAAADL